MALWRSRQPNRAVHAQRQREVGVHLRIGCPVLGLDGGLGGAGPDRGVVALEHGWQHGPDGRLAPAKERAHRDKVVTYAFASIQNFFGFRSK